MGNDSLIKDYPKFKDPKKQLVPVGTTCLRNIKIALDLEFAINSHKPKIAKLIEKNMNQK